MIPLIVWTLVVWTIQRPESLDLHIRQDRRLELSVDPAGGRIPALGGWACSYGPEPSPSNVVTGRDVRCVRGDSVVTVPVGCNDRGHDEMQMTLSEGPNTPFTWIHMSCAQKPRR